MSNYFLGLMLTVAQFGQSTTGELRLKVTDPAGLPIGGHVSLVSEANHIVQEAETTPQGTLIARRLPFGRYRLEVSAAGFAAFRDLVEIRSALPFELHVTLGLAPVQARLTVGPGETLLD